MVAAPAQVPVQIDRRMAIQVEQRARELVPVLVPIVPVLIWVRLPAAGRRLLLSFSVSMIV